MTKEEILEYVEVVDSPAREEVRVYRSHTADLMFLIHYHEIEEIDPDLDPWLANQERVESWVLEHYKEEIEDMLG